jgi:hypothetical protein
MLDLCAPGYAIALKKHHWWVTFGGRTFRRLPTGEHGERNPEIQVGIIRQLIRFLIIDMDCAKQHLEILR